MPARSLHIAWLGPAPGEHGGVPGVAGDLIEGLARLGHRIDCFLPSSGLEVPAHLVAQPRITFVWGTLVWRWNRWYSRTRTTALLSGMLGRALASVRLRRQVLRRHRGDPYDVVYQFSSIETPAVPARLVRLGVPLVIHPETHSAGELRALLQERKLSLRTQSHVRFALVAAIMLARSLLQRPRIRRASLLVCISSVFRDHMVRDYAFPIEGTVVVPNPVRLERFRAIDRPPRRPLEVLVLGRVVARKGVESVVELARLLRERGAPAHIRVVGGPSLWSDYTSLLGELPPENAEYAGSVPGPEIPGELAGSDVLLAPSTYEPFGLMVAEALATGLPVVATSEVGAIEGVGEPVAITVAPGDIEAMADAIARLGERLESDPAGTRARARSEAERLFAREVVCEKISAALQALVASAQTTSANTPHGSAAPNQTLPSTPRRPA